MSLAAGVSWRSPVGPWSLPGAPRFRHVGQRAGSGSSGVCPPGGNSWLASSIMATVT